MYRGFKPEQVATDRTQQLSRTYQCSANIDTCLLNPTANLHTCPDSMSPDASAPSSSEPPSGPYRSRPLEAIRDSIGMRSMPPAPPSPPNRSPLPSVLLLLLPLRPSLEPCLAICLANCLLPLRLSRLRDSTGWATAAAAAAVLSGAGVRSRLVRGERESGDSRGCRKLVVWCLSSCSCRELRGPRGAAAATGGAMSRSSGTWSDLEDCGKTKRQQSSQDSRTGRGDQQVNDALSNIVCDVGRGSDRGRGSGRGIEAT